MEAVIFSKEMWLLIYIRYYIYVYMFDKTVIINKPILFSDKYRLQWYIPNYLYG